MASIVVFFGPSGLFSSTGVMLLAYCKTFQIVDLAVPGFPMIKTECLTSRISESWTHLRMKLSSA